MSATSENRRIGAFFDVDGTLVPPPSLERRFFGELRQRRLIPAKNYLLWLAHAWKLLPQGIGIVQHANKMYLRGLHVAALAATRDIESHFNLFGPVGIPVLNEMAFERLIWHTLQRHAIVLVTGTLAPLAQNFALQLIVKFAARGITASIGVCATELEERDSLWTGRILGEPMLGQTKARAIERIGREQRLDLTHSYAYADNVSDRWMLEAVGRPTAVNPAQDLQLIARRNDWPVLWWNNEKRHSPQRPQTAQRKSEVFVGPGELG